MKPKSMLWLLAAMLLIALPMLVACNTAPATTTPPQTTTPTTTSPTTTPPQTTTPTTTSPTTTPLTTPVSFEVEINYDTFIPANITVPVGATVTWIHRDREADSAVWFHNVTSETGLFDSGLLAFGDTFSYTFTERGTFNYYNNEFPYRHGTVIVE